MDMIHTQSRGHRRRCYLDQMMTRAGDNSMKSIRIWIHLCMLCGRSSIYYGFYLLLLLYFETEVAATTGVVFASFFFVNILFLILLN